MGAESATLTVVDATSDQSTGSTSNPLTKRHLSPTYAQARKSFRSAAVEAGARLASHPHPLKGPDGEDLAIDIAEFGPADASSVLLIVSATHGVEGFAGSALQHRWLQDHAGDRPDDVRVIVLHAFNPYGFAWVRRVNEDNVDLNRNFIDWSEPAPSNDNYDAIADLVVPTFWTEAEQERTLNLLLEHLAEVGMEELQATVSGGQYTNPNGVFYGGAEAVWSHRWLKTWAAKELRQAKRVAILDLHTGLGEWGTAQLIGANAPGSPEHLRASDWYGSVVAMGGADSVSAYLYGDWLRGVLDILTYAEVTAVAIEYGTIDPISVLMALRADAWLHGHGDPTGPDAPAIKAQVRGAFADDDPAWVEAIWGRFASCVAQAFEKLSLS